MTTRFFFHSNSKDEAPGRGCQEVIEQCNVHKFDELAKIKHWRRQMSNFAISPFIFNGLEWNTVEHAFQAAKFINTDKQLYFSFSLNSGSEFSKQSGNEARKRRKSIVLNKDELAKWDEVKNSIMKELWLARFTQDEQSKNVLLLTQDAELWHGMPRSAAMSRLTALEEVREMLMKIISASDH